MTLITQPVRLERTPASLQSAAPAIGADTDEVLREFGFDDAAIEQLRAVGAV